MALVDSYPGLLDRLTNGEEDDLIHVGELVSRLVVEGRGVTLIVQ